jgi:hypothetical protein
MLPRNPQRHRDDFRSRLADQRAALDRKRALIAGSRTTSPQPDGFEPDAAVYAAAPLQPPGVQKPLELKEAGNVEPHSVQDAIPRSIPEQFRIIPKRIAQIRTAAGQEPVPVPHILHVLVSVALATEERRPICVILPSTSGIPQAVGLFAAVECLAADWEEMRATYIPRVFKEGSKFRNIDDGRIYEFCSLANYDGQRFIKFKTTRRRNSRAQICDVSFPEAKALSFEPTFKRNPNPETTGKGAPIHATAVDLLAGSHTKGNTGMIKNRVILIGRQTEFERFLEQLRLSTCDHSPDDFLALNRTFPRGGFDSMGRPVVRKPAGSAGQPVVAISPDLMTLESASLAAEVSAQSQVIITDRTNAVLHNLDLAHRLAERQRLVLLSDASSREDAASLRGNGWAVWEPAPHELLPASGHVFSDLGIPGVERIQQAALAEASGKTAWMELRCAALERARTGIELLYSQLHHESVVDDETLQGIYATANGLFFDAISWLQNPGEEYAAHYEAIRRTLDEGGGMLGWSLGKDATSSLRMFLESVDDHYNSLRLGKPSPKGETLLRLAQSAVQSANFRQVFVTGSRSTRDDADKFFRDHGINLSCHPAERLRDAEALSGAVAFSVMRREHFNHLVDPWPTRHLIFLGYVFETDIYRRRLDVRNRLKSGLSLTQELRARMTGLDGPFFSHHRRATEAGPELKPLCTTPERSDRLEQAARQNDWRWVRKVDVPSSRSGDTSILAKIVRFVGRSWMAVTEDHRLLCLKGPDLSARASGSHPALDNLTVAELNVGMRLVVREAGEKDVIRMLAEERVGPSRYGHLLETASLWRTALRSSGLEADKVSHRLETSGVRRHPATIRSWLTNDNVIGPRTEDDVLAIAQAFPISGRSEGDWHTCWEAIEELRSLHISCGSRLSDLIEKKSRDILLDQNDQEIAMDVGVGIIWIVEVGDISGDFSPVPASYCNRIHWETGAWRERLLRQRILVS